MHIEVVIILVDKAHYRFAQKQIKLNPDSILVINLTENMIFESPIQHLMAKTNFMCEQKDSLIGSKEHGSSYGGYVFLLSPNKIRQFSIMTKALYVIQFQLHMTSVLIQHSLYFPTAFSLSSPQTPSLFATGFTNSPTLPKQLNCN